jgi:D-xylose 1-dehydrogenase
MIDAEKDLMLQQTTGATDRALYPSLRDKRVIVTGGGSGIGEGLVEAFVAQGACVAFVDINDAASEALVARLSPDARHAPAYRHCDVTDLDALASTFADLEAQLGGVDILVNNAGNDDRHTLDEVTPDYWACPISSSIRRARPRSRA